MHVGLGVSLTVSVCLLQRINKLHAFSSCNCTEIIFFPSRTSHSVVLLHWGAAGTDLKWLMSFLFVCKIHRTDRSSQQSRSMLGFMCPCTLHYWHILTASAWVNRLKYLFSLLLKMLLKSCLDVSLCFHLLYWVLSRLQKNNEGRSQMQTKMSLSAEEQYYFCSSWKYHLKNIWNSYLIEANMKYRRNLTGLILRVCWDYSLHCSTVASEVCCCK